MTTCLVAFAVAFAVALAATVAVRAGARRLGVVDRPDRFRKLHSREVPLLGGVAVYVGFAAPVLALLFLHHNALSVLLHESAGQVAALIVGGGLVLGVGALDDVRGVPARWKLIAQASAASMAFAGGFGISTVSNPFGPPLALGLLSYPVTLLWLVGCMNAVNLLDGLDGLAAGVCLFAAMTLCLVSLLFDQMLSMLLMLCLSGSVLAFLLFNFHPATVFLGDSGSLLLGFLMGCLSLSAARKTEATIALIIPFVALGLPVFDTMLAVLRRWLRRLPLSTADRRHVHHVLLSMGLSHRQAVLALYAACLLLGAAALLITAGRDEVTLLVLGSLAIMAFVCVRLFGGMRFLDLWSRLSAGLAQRHDSAEARISVERAIARMNAVRDTRELWQAFCGCLEGLRLDFAVLQLFPRDAAQPQVFAWVSPQQEDAPGGAPSQSADMPVEGWSAQLQVRFNGHSFGRLRVGRKAGRGPPLADAPELVDRLRAEMANQMERLAIGRTGRPLPAPPDLVA
jgi:UDP-GlcNAc:undecaprenyl-phosphate GlcNAc-1-phosphate transferase